MLTQGIAEWEERILKKTFWDAESRLEYKFLPWKFILHFYIFPCLYWITATRDSFSITVIWLMISSTGTQTAPFIMISYPEVRLGNYMCINYTSTSLQQLHFLVLIRYGFSKLQIIDEVDFAIYGLFHSMVYSFKLRWVFPESLLEEIQAIISLARCIIC